VTKKAKREAPDTSPPDADDAVAEQSAVDDVLADEVLSDDAEPAEEVDPLEAAQTEAQQAVDRELRCRAELENYRKRAARQMDEQRRYANLPLMRDLLPSELFEFLTPIGTDWDAPLDDSSFPAATIPGPRADTAWRKTLPWTWLENSATK
jgi:hypothetical protein